MNDSSISEIVSPGNPKEPAVRAPDHEVIEIVDGAPPVQECTDKLCSRGFTEKEWNDAYKRWKQLADYSSSSDMDLDYKPPEQTKTSRPLCDGELSLAAAMELDDSKPDDVPDYFQKILGKYSHANKKKRRSYS